jgi:hypothetical protein
LPDSFRGDGSIGKDCLRGVSPAGLPSRLHSRDARYTDSWEHLKGRCTLGSFEARLSTLAVQMSSSETWPMSWANHVHGGDCSTPASPLRMRAASRMNLVARAPNCQHRAHATSQFLQDWPACSLRRPLLRAGKSHARSSFGASPFSVSFITAEAARYFHRVGTGFA